MIDNAAAFTQPELLLHPARFRILQALSGEALTTQQIAERLPDVPTSSTYRHVKMLLDAGMIEVTGTQLVKGIQEKRYALARPANGQPADFTGFLLNVLDGYAGYRRTEPAPAPQPPPAPELPFDRAGYTEVLVWASRDEIERFVTTLNVALRPLLVNGPAAGRRKHKIAFITRPEK